MPSERVPYALTHLDTVERIGDEHGDWRPLRRALDVTAFGLAAFTGAHVGDEVIEPHDERSPNAGAHEEVYLVVAGAARFEVGGEAFEAPLGTCVRVDVGTHRVAWAAQP